MRFVAKIAFFSAMLAWYLPDNIASPARGGGLAAIGTRSGGLSTKDERVLGSLLLGHMLLKGVPVLEGCELHRQKIVQALLQYSPR